MNNEAEKSRASDNKQPSKTVFDRIASIYGWFYGYQISHYAKVIGQVEKSSGLSEYRTILDVGSGTGALCAALTDCGYEATGVEPSLPMLQVARKKTRQNRERTGAIPFYQGDALKGLPFAEDSFDVVFATYVAHGMPKSEREILYKEMKRVSHHLVILQDYNENRSRLTDLVEWMEGGDYFYFIRHVQEELKNHFEKVDVIQVGERAAWYICHKESKGTKHK